MLFVRKILCLKEEILSKCITNKEHFSNFTFLFLSLETSYIGGHGVSLSGYLRV